MKVRVKPIPAASKVRLRRVRRLMKAPPVGWIPVDNLPRRGGLVSGFHAARTLRTVDDRARKTGGDSDRSLHPAGRPAERAFAGGVSGPHEVVAAARRRRDVRDAIPRGAAD